MSVKHLLLASAVALGGASVASAQVVLAVDFNATFNASSTTEASLAFQNFNVLTNAGSANPSQTFGSYTVQLFGSTVQGRYRSALTDSGSFTYNDLLEDLATNFNRVASNASNNASTTPTSNALTISGLATNTTYQIQLWSLDTGFNNGAVQYWWNTTAGTGANATLLGSIVNATTPTLTNNNAYSIVATMTSSATGTLSLGYVATAGSGTINGFVISAIPEPSAAAALAGAAALGLVAYRRRRT